MISRSHEERNMYAINKVNLHDNKARSSLLAKVKPDRGSIRMNDNIAL